jgi:hypothetical protein
MGLKEVTEPCGVETERKRWLGWNLALPKTKQEPGEVGQLGQHLFSRMQIERNQLLDEIGRVKDGEVG